MKKFFIGLTVILLSFKIGYGQVYNNNSVYFLNIERVFKIKVLKIKAPEAIIPQVNIAYPYSAFDTVSRVVSILDVYPIAFITSDTTTALIRISKCIDESFGSGSTDDLFQYSNSPLILDSLIRLDSISSEGIFHLTINHQKVYIRINDVYSLIIHNEVDSPELLLDYIVEYSIINHGYFRRKVECEIY